MLSDIKSKSCSTHLWVWILKKHIHYYDNNKKVKFLLQLQIGATLDQFATYCVDVSRLKVAPVDPLKKQY